jgi:uncharacterized protein YneF (UPF0154 family)
MVFKSITFLAVKSFQLFLVFVFVGYWFDSRLIQKTKPKISWKSWRKTMRTVGKELEKV